jgi:SPP1 gp7 family putative phage head morphogenesis protein
MADDLQAAVETAYAEICPPTHAHDARRTPEANLKSTMKKWGDRWVKRFDRLSVDLATKFAGKSFQATQLSMKAAFRQAGFTVKFQPTPASKAAYSAVASEQVNLIKSIPQQYLKDVQTHVWQSVMKGGDMATLSRKLKETYGVTTNRAALIARDQNNKAKAVLERTRRQELGITEAIWQHSGGGKTQRRTHVKASGERYRIDQGLWDSDAGEYVHPGELINCRCTSKAVLPF